MSEYYSLHWNSAVILTHFYHFGPKKKDLKKKTPIDVSFCQIPPICCLYTKENNIILQNLNFNSISFSGQISCHEVILHGPIFS